MWSVVGRPSRSGVERGRFAMRGSRVYWHSRRAMQDFVPGLFILDSRTGFLPVVSLLLAAAMRIHDHGARVKECDTLRDS
jgi:hypothetical protein